MRSEACVVVCEGLLQEESPLLQQDRGIVVDRRDGPWLPQGEGEHVVLAGGPLGVLFAVVGSEVHSAAGGPADVHPHSRIGRCAQGESAASLGLFGELAAGGLAFRLAGAAAL